ncbi:MAG: patatin-like phospholipase family protein [Gemmatimonadales bacterium]
MVASPVDEANRDPRHTTHLTDGVGLCLSGGGYRAMLFHVGALWRLNELGWLRRLNRISSVSGGSITNGVLGLAWKNLEFDDAGIALAFRDEVVAPIRKFANRTVDIRAVIGGLLTAESAACWVAEAYDAHLFNERTLQDLPDDKPHIAPRFVFNAANVQTGTLFRISKPYIWDWRVGQVRQPRLKVSLAVAASSAFPPFLSPLRLSFRDEEYVKGSGWDLQMPPYTTSPTLTDGGVYDNLGLETVWKRYRTILVSDGGGRMGNSPTPHRDWLLHTKRVLDVVDHQVRSLRKRQVIGAFQLPRDHSTTWRNGTYWGIRTDIANYQLGDSLACPHKKTMRLAEEPTRLGKIPAGRQERIINWGYAVCDAAMRRWVIAEQVSPPRFPYPSAGVG